MKVKRAREFRRAWKYYQIKGHYVSPYRVFLDGNFVAECIKRHISIKALLIRLLKGRVLLFTTKCVVNELQKLGDDLKDVYTVCKELFQEKCKHSFFLDPMSCVINLVEGLRVKILIASQDQELHKKIMEKYPKHGFPIIYFDEEQQLSLVQPPGGVKDINEVEELDKYLPREDEYTLINLIRKEERKEEYLRRKEALRKERFGMGLLTKRKAKGANPLSVKKSHKSKDTESDQVALPKKKRNRRKLRQCKRHHPMEPMEEVQNVNIVVEPPATPK